MTDYWKSVHSEFEWDLAKATINFAKHQISFFEATEAFSDPFAVEWIDDTEDYGEIRTIICGLANGNLVAVAFTERGDFIRLISARKANRREIGYYHRQEIP